MTIDPDMPPWARGPLTRKQFLGGAAVSIGGLSFLVACGSSGDGGTPGPRGQNSLVIDMELEPSSLNGHDINLQYLRWPLDNVEETLYTWADDGEIVPLLAADMPEAVDDLVREIRLREGVVFHNGDPLTAEAVVTNYKSGRGDGRVWASHLAPVDKIEAVDELTVRFTFAQPWGLLLEKASRIPIIHPDYVERKDAMMGTGPYKFEEFSSGSHILLSAWEDYRDGKPPIDELRFRIVPEAGARLVNLLSRDSTMATEPNYPDLDSLEREDSVTVINLESPLDILMWPNHGKPPFDDERVRQALAFSMNRKQVRDVVFAGRAEIGQGPIPPGMIGYDGRTVYSPEPDLDRARSLLRDAGYAEGEEIEFEFVATANQVLQDMAVILQQTWAEVGFVANLSFLEIGAWISKWASGKGWGVVAIFSSDGQATGRSAAVGGANALQPGNAINFTGYEDKELGRVIEQAKATEDPAEAEKLWAEYSYLAAVKAAQIPPVYPRLVHAHRAELQGLPASTLGINVFDFKEASIGS